MQINIDFRSGQPIYTQIIEQVRQMVANGQLQIGDQLPTVRQLATELRVNFNTVARAYRILDEAGLISTQQGRGTYVWEKPSEEILDRLKDEELAAITNRYLAEAARLGCHPDEISETITNNLSRWKEQGFPPKPFNEE